MAFLRLRSWKNRLCMAGWGGGERALSTEHSLHPLWGRGLSTARSLHLSSTVPGPGCRALCLRPRVPGCLPPLRQHPACPGTLLPSRPHRLPEPTASTRDPTAGPGWAGMAPAGPPGLGEGHHGGQVGSPQPRAQLSLPTRLHPTTTSEFLGCVWADVTPHGAAEPALAVALCPVSGRAALPPTPSTSPSHSTAPALRGVGHTGADGGCAGRGSSPGAVGSNKPSPKQRVFVQELPAARPRLM